MYYCIWCSALVVVDCGCVELRCELCAHDAAPHNHSQPQSAQPVQNTICGSTWSCSPNDGHNDAQNMLRQKFDNKHQISCILLVSLSSSSKSLILGFCRAESYEMCL